MAVFLPVTAGSVFNFAPLPIAIPNCEPPTSAALPTAIVSKDVLFVFVPIAMALLVGEYAFVPIAIEFSPLALVAPSCLKLLPIEIA